MNKETRSPSSNIFFIQLCASSYINNVQHYIVYPGIAPRENFAHEDRVPFRSNRGTSLAFYLALISNTLIFVILIRERQNTRQEDRLDRDYIAMRWTASAGPCTVLMWTCVCADARMCVRLCRYNLSWYHPYHTPDNVHSLPRTSASASCVLACKHERRETPSLYLLLRTRARQR